MTWTNLPPASGFNFIFTGFAPDVKVWEVKFTKSGEFQEVKRAFELTGHASGVYDMAFDVDSSHMATISKDGTWKVFNTKGTSKRNNFSAVKLDLISGYCEKYLGTSWSILFSVMTNIGTNLFTHLSRRGFGRHFPKCKKIVFFKYSSLCQV